MKQWYIVQFKPNAHRLAERNLQRQGFETFLPMQEITRQESSRFVANLRPIFPGYIFVYVDEESGPWYKINSTKGVSRLVSVNCTPKPIPFQLISSLMLRFDTEGKLLPPKTLKSGDNVEVLNGPFENFVAIVETIDEQQRVWILMEFMGRSTKMQISPDQIRLEN